MSAGSNDKTFKIKNRAGLMQQTKQNKTMALFFCQQGDRAGARVIDDERERSIPPRHDKGL